MTRDFAQRGCTMVAYQAGGALVAGPRKNGCLVEVIDGELIIQEGPGDLVDRAAVPDVQIDPPVVQRALGGSTFVRMNDHRWAIDFGFAYQAERTGRTSTLGLMLGGGLKAVRFARRRNREFGRC